MIMALTTGIPKSAAVKPGRFLPILLPLNPDPLLLKSTIWIYFTATITP